MTQRMPLENYVERVVATEGSVEDQPEALKALAIAARTYAMKNLKRHAHSGYDFCSTRIASVLKHPKLDPRHRRRKSHGGYGSARRKAKSPTRISARRAAA